MQYKDYAQSEKNLGEYINTLMLIVGDCKGRSYIFTVT